MPHKDPIAAAAYWADYYARPETKEKNRAKVDAWRKRNPRKARIQGRRTKKASRDRQALAALAEAKKVTEKKRKAVASAIAKQIEKYGYIGRINVERI